jgi:N-acetylglucosamine-6-phosphate deacetylase
VTQLKGILVTPQGLVYGTLMFSNLIEDIQRLSGRDDLYILPGFIDAHVHGGAGGDTMDGAEGVLKFAAFHLQHGTTTLYPTTMTNPWANILKALRGVKEVRQEQRHDLPSIPGVHLEGPFISPNRLGAQPPFTLEPTRDLLDDLLVFDIIRLVTLAPEIPGVLDAATAFAGAKVRVSIGHSAATYEQTQTFMTRVRRAKGILGFTHLYNAMTGLSGREPGVVGAALADKPLLNKIQTDEESFAELIFDTHHVHSASFIAALKAKPEHLFLITDCIRAGGLPDGETELGGQAVHVTKGKTTLKDGTLAGSVLTLDQALRNALELGLDLGTISQLLSKTPARYMGLQDRGVIETGKRADLVVLDKNMRVLEVYVAGKKQIG